MIKYTNLGQNISDRMVYLRSTDVEQLNYHRLLWSIPDEILYFLSKGETIVIEDISSNKGKIEHIFIPVLIDVLNHMYNICEPIAKRLKEHYIKAYIALEKDRHLSKKYMFWKGRINEIKIIGKTIHVNKEPNTIYGD